MTFEKKVDESWKDSVAGEKTQPNQPGDEKSGQPQDQTDTPADQWEMNFLNYMTSLAFQALIFLGEIPNPMNDNKVETNLNQAKMLIDTLSMLREKTKGNLSSAEDDLLNSSIYELQMKYVEKAKSSDFKIDLP